MTSPSEALETLARAERACVPLELAASIVEIANENMASAIKMVSLERGHDPRRFALLAFGGAGPLHAAAVARALGIPQVIVPHVPGRLLGARHAARRHPRRQGLDAGVPLETTSTPALVDAAVRGDPRAALGRAAQEGFSGEPDRAPRDQHALLRAELRARGASLGERADDAALEGAFRRFDEMHAERYGYAIEGEVIELVSFKVTVIGRRRPPLRPHGRER